MHALAVALFALLVQVVVTAPECIAGNFFDGTACVPCPAGFYCETGGLVAPSGLCDAGWCCVANSTTAEGTGLCQVGSFSAGGATTVACTSFFQVSPAVYPSTAHLHLSMNATWAGLSDLSSRLRIGASICSSTNWLSETFTSCTISSGVFKTLYLLATVRKQCGFYPYLIKTFVRLAFDQNIRLQGADQASCDFFSYHCSLFGQGSVCRFALEALKVIGGRSSLLAPGDTVQFMPCTKTNFQSIRMPFDESRRAQGCIDFIIAIALSLSKIAGKSQKICVKEFISSFETFSCLFWRRTNVKFYDHFQTSLIPIIDCFQTTSSVFNSSYDSNGPHASEGNMLMPYRFIDVNKHTHLIISSRVCSVGDHLPCRKFYETFLSADSDSVTFTIDFLQNHFSKRKKRWENKGCRRSVTACVQSSQQSNFIGAVYSASFSPKTSSVTRHLVRCCSASCSCSSLQKLPFTLMVSPNYRGAFDVLVDADIFTCSILLALSFVFYKLRRALMAGRASSRIFRPVTSSLPQPLGHSLVSTLSSPCSASDIAYASPLCSFLFMAIKFHLGHSLQLHTFCLVCLAISSRSLKHLFCIFSSDRSKLVQHRSQPQVKFAALLLCISISSFCVDGQGMVRNVPNFNHFVQCRLYIVLALCPFVVRAMHMMMQTFSV
jgi:hypothetical protein